MPVTVGLQHAGSFQVAGWPYLAEKVIDTNEEEFQFDFISQEITVWNAGGETLKFYYTSGSGTVFELPPTKKVTMRVKAGSIFAKSSTGTTTIKLFVSMTNIPLERIGVIPTGSYFGPVDMTDGDGDGIPDIADTNPLDYDMGAPDTSLAEPDAIGTNQLWLEYDNGTEEKIEYDSEEGMGVIPDTIVFLPNEAGDCAGSLTEADFDPLMQMLTAHYVDESTTPPTKGNFEIDHSLHDDVNMLITNATQIMELTVSRTYGMSLTETVKVGIPVLIYCPDTTTPPTGDFLEGSFGTSEYTYPCDEDICIDPECWDAELWEED